jgi:hypothetical protein
MLDEGFARNLGLPFDKTRSMVGFYWDIPVPTGPRSRMQHRMFVSQQHGRTEIVLWVRSTTDRDVPEKAFVTSPLGRLEKTWSDGRGKPGAGKPEEIARAEAEADFQREVDFWLKQVGKVSPRWPLELIPEK